MTLLAIIRLVPAQGNAKERVPTFYVDRSARGTALTMGICLIVVAKRGGSKSIVPYVSGSTIVRDRCREATAIVTGGIGFRLFEVVREEKGA